MKKPANRSNPKAPTRTGAVNEQATLAVPAAQPLSQVHEGAWTAFLQSASALSTRVDHDLQRETGGITLAEIDILLALDGAEKNRLHITELTNPTRLSRFAIPRQVKKMLKTGYVEMQVDSADARATWIVLTPKGKKEMDGRLRLAYENAVQLHFARLLTPKHAEALVHLFTRLIVSDNDQ